MTTDTATPSGSDVTNPDERERLLEQARAEVREEKQERREMTAMQRRIERSLAEETITLPVGDESVEFSTFDRSTSEWASLLQERIRRLDGEDYQAEFHAECDRIYETLAEHSAPTWMTQEWWEDHCSIRRAIQFITSISVEMNLSEEEYARFRGE